MQLPTCWWTANRRVGVRGKGLETGVGGSWQVVEVPEKRKKRDFLIPLPSMALEPCSVAASRVVSMLESSRNFILKVKREKTRLAPESQSCSRTQILLVEGDITGSH